MNREFVGIAIVVAIIAFTILYSRKPSSIDNLDPVENNFPRFHLLRGASDGDGTVHLKSLLDGQFGTLVLRDNELFSEKRQADGTIKTGGDRLDDELREISIEHRDESGKYTRETLIATFTPDYYLIEPFDSTRIDAGTWAAYKEGEDYQIGVRFSPLRVFYGAVAGDIVASQRSWGGGFSLYPPPKFVGRFWSHIGIGAWYTLPYSADNTDMYHSGWNYGITFSTR